jgi:high-affinity Fe2+/Pb2+ permease
MKGRVVMFLIIFQETTGAFDDLGKLLLGGVAAAIVLAIGFALIRIRIRDNKPQTSNFISISATESEPPSR